MSLARRPGAGSSSYSHASQALAERPEWVGVGADNSALVVDKGNQSLIHMTATAQDHVRAYLEYDRIVGDADGGKMLTEEEYEKFKANAIAHRANRIYVAWRNMSTQVDCRQIGPSSRCFCGHWYKQHATDNHNKNIFCRQAGCPCALFDYIPVRGTQDVKCSGCKHSYEAHRVTGTRKCKAAGCTACGGFHTSLSCSCNAQYAAHQTVFETREERQAAGRPVDNLADGGAGYEALGGLTSFSSLVDGVDRMQIGPSGEPELVGAPPPRKKLTQEDEFALYEQKYKKGGSAASAVSRRPRIPSSNRDAATSSSVAAAVPTSATPAAAATAVPSFAEPQPYRRDDRPPAGMPTRSDDRDRDGHDRTRQAPVAQSRYAAATPASDPYRNDRPLVAQPRSTHHSNAGYAGAPSRSRPTDRDAGFRL